MLANTASAAFSLRPLIFIASATEGHAVAGALRDNMDRNAEVTLWTEEVFRPSEFSLESLMNTLERTQFGIFVLTSDDVAAIRGQFTYVPRDNVLFELGLFMGRLGRERCFAVVPNDVSLHLPSDIAGLKVVSFDNRRGDGNLIAATGPAARSILRSIAETKTTLGPKAEQTANEILQAAARLIALRANLNENEVRGFLHLYDAEERCLLPVAKYIGIRQHVDAGIHIPCDGPNYDWYVISRAFNQNRFVSEEVDWNAAHVTGAPHHKDVWGDLKSVVAHPVRPPRREAVPIGTIDFDSSEELKKLGWKSDRDLRDIMTLLANTLYTIVSKVH